MPRGPWPRSEVAVYGPAIATLYDRLGVGPRASQDEIRAAYRRLARSVHPDRGASGSEAAMAAVNEAWSVLGDPARRASYDASLARATVPVRTVRPDEDVDDGRDDDLDDEAADARSFWAVALPWILVLAVLGGIFLFTAYAGGFGSGDTPTPRPVDGVIEVGSCVRLNDVARAVEVPCGGPHTGVVGAIVVAGAACPLHTEGFFDLPGEHLICITRD